MLAPILAPASMISGAALGDDLLVESDQVGRSGQVGHVVITLHEHLLHDRFVAGAGAVVERARAQVARADLDRGDVAAHAPDRSTRRLRTG